MNKESHKFIKRPILTNFVMHIRKSLYSMQTKFNIYSLFSLSLSLSQALRAKTFLPDLVPPNKYFPPPGFFDSTHPPGLDAECNTLFSFFAPAFTGQRCYSWLCACTHTCTCMCRHVHVHVIIIMYTHIQNVIVLPNLTVPPRF